MHDPSAERVAPGPAGRGRRAALLLGLFLFVSGTHALSPAATSIDSRWSLFTAQSILREGNTDLNEYRGMIFPQDYRLIVVRDADGPNVYDRFPLVPSLLALPFVWAIERAGPWLGFDLDRYLRDHWGGRVEVVVASCVVGATALVLFLLVRSIGLAQGQALLVTATFAYATSAWSIASRALWQHGPSMLLLTTSLWLLVRARGRPTRLGILGLPLALALVARPTNIPAVALLVAWVGWRHPRQLLRLGAWAAVVAVPYLIFNFEVYHEPLPPYYLAGYDKTDEYPQTWLTIARALAGNLVSPARGLFVYSPILALALPGAWIGLRGRHRELFAIAALIVVGQWLLVSSYAHWWGGWSYGPRYLSDVTPLLTLLAAPTVPLLWRRPASARGWGVAALLAAALAWSVFVHGRGATSMAPHWWNRDPVNVDLAPSRLWDWRDPPFFR